MALQLNLLHEEFTEQRQRKRDPLKLGMIALGAVGAVMLAFYMLKAYQTLAFKNQLSEVEHEWAKVEPKVTVAQKRAAELAGIINATNVLDARVESRFLWAPLLQTISACVAPNIQLTNLDGTASEEKQLQLSLEGMAAGSEPRAAAEEFRQLLSEKLADGYGSVDVQFKGLEDLDTPVMLAGTALPAARLVISISLKPKGQAATQSPIANTPEVKK